MPSLARYKPDILCKLGRAAGHAINNGNSKVLFCKKHKVAWLSDSSRPHKCNGINLAKIGRITMTGQGSNQGPSHPQPQISALAQADRWMKERDNIIQNLLKEKDSLQSRITMIDNTLAEMQKLSTIHYPAITPVEPRCFPSDPIIEKKPRAETTARIQQINDLLGQGISKHGIAAKLSMTYVALHAFMKYHHLEKQESVQAEPIAPQVEDTKLSVDEDLHGGVTVPFGVDFVFDPAIRAANTQQLKEELTKRQHGNKNLSVEFLTTASGPIRLHVHVATVDHFGDGQTNKDSTGHVHRISKWAVAFMHNHFHQWQ
jgi:hypothetical protein